MMDNCQSYGCGRGRRSRSECQGKKAIKSTRASLVHLQSICDTSEVRLSAESPKIQSLTTDTEVSAIVAQDCETPQFIINTPA